ncbi:MAG: thioredoxin family protein [Verrucomicrobium sp.]|nr:thioredoxin family protein [Verrucomicrobium sp.]
MGFFLAWVFNSAAEPFQDLSFDAALLRAAQENKIVLVDFFTTWCQPCKMLDETTWKDPAVIGLLREKTVALRIDAEKEAPLAQRYNVHAYPTVALIKPDGTMIDGLVGYRDAKTFQADFLASLSGKTSFMRAQEAVEKAQGDAQKTAQARFQLGQELVREGKDQEALAEYLWCYDVGMAQVPAMVGVRDSFLTMSIGQLGKRYAPAKEALQTRRKAAGKKLEENRADMGALLDFVALTDALEGKQAVLAYFDALPPGDPRRPLVGKLVFRQFLEAKRYGDAVEARPYVTFQAEFAAMLNAAQSPSQQALPENARERLHAYVLEDGAIEAEALAGAGKLDDAGELVGKILAMDKSEKTRAMLHEHLTRAGHAELLKAE